MQPGLPEIDSVIQEAEMVRSRHDGVHVVHSCLTALRICRHILLSGDWAPDIAASYDETVAKLRFIDRTGFAPKRNLPVARDFVRLPGMETAVVGPRN
jgi:hypothetical protein